MIEGFDSVWGVLEVISGFPGTFSDGKTFPLDQVVEFAPSASCLCLKTSSTLYSSSPLIISGGGLMKLAIAYGLYSGQCGRRPLRRGVMSRMHIFYLIFLYFIRIYLMKYSCLSSYH